MKNKKNTYYSSNCPLLLIFIGVLCYSPMFSQKEKKHIYEGNKLYDLKKYNDAEKQYSTAVTKNKDSYKASFNLGDAYYKQGKYDEAAEQFQALTHKATSKDTLSKAYHNLGNALLKAKKYKESVDAFKQSLKNDPSDEDTRYNLAYAQQYLKQQQQQQNKNKNDKDKDDKKDQKNKDNKENKDKKRDKEKDDKKNDNKKDDQKNNEEQQKDKISKDDAERLLEALQNDERKLQEKKRAQKVKGAKIEIEKDW